MELEAVFFFVVLFYRDDGGEGIGWDISCGASAAKKHFLGGQEVLKELVKCSPMVPAGVTAGRPKWRQIGGAILTPSLVAGVGFEPTTFWL